MDRVHLRKYKCIVTAMFTSPHTLCKTHLGMREGEGMCATWPVSQCLEHQAYCLRCTLTRFWMVWAQMVFSGFTHRLRQNCKTGSKWAGSLWGDLNLLKNKMRHWCTLDSLPADESKIGPIELHTNYASADKLGLFLAQGQFATVTACVQSVFINRSNHLPIL